MQTFKNQTELDAYKAHLLAGSTEKFMALGLGPITPEMAVLSMPPGVWSNPGHAAAEGAKLILTGPPGSGKTTLLKKITWGLALRRRRPRGGYIPAMLDHLKSGDIGSYTAWLTSGDLLVLDDLDKLRGTQYEAERLLAAINHYDVNRFPIIVTMNVELDQFGDRIRAGGVPADYAESIVSRLRGRSTSHFVSGPDHRTVA